MDKKAEMIYSEDFIMAVLEYARDYGTTIAARHFQIQHSTINRWNIKHNVYVPRTARKFTKEKKIEILEYANKHGLSSAMREYDVDMHTMSVWNDKLGIYQQTGHKKDATHKKHLTRESEEFKLEVLNYAKTKGVSKTVRKYNVPDSTIRLWNKQYKIYAPRKARAFSDAEKKLMIKYAAEHTVPDAARKYDVSSDQIRKWASKFFQEKL